MTKFKVGDILRNKIEDSPYSYQIVRIEEGDTFAGTNKNYLQLIDENNDVLGMAGWLSNEQIDRAYEVVSQKRKPNEPKRCPYQEGLI